jgi:hypothetical protein
MPFFFHGHKNSISDGNTDEYPARVLPIIIPILTVLFSRFQASDNLKEES